MGIVLSRFTKHAMEVKSNPEPVIQETCASCGAKLKGNYCRKCGEKMIIPERDFSLKKFANLTLWHFIHFDSKWLRSCWLLFSKPGFLTAEWIAGRRIRYMKPLQMFVVASVLFYFFLPTTTAYFTSVNDLVVGYREQNFMMNTFQYDVENVLSKTSERLKVGDESLANHIMATAPQRSKAWLFILIPFWGAWIFLFYHRKIPWLVPHLMFAMHGLIFYILTDLGIHALVYISGLENIGKTIFLMLNIIFPVYLAISTRRVYGNSWPVTILKTVAIAAGFTALMLLYRQLVTISTLAFLT